MSHNPSPDLLRWFDARLVAPLGGRLNQHWQVEVQGTAYVLRRWAQLRADVMYEVELVARLAAMGWPVAAAIDPPIEQDGAFWSLAPLLPGAPPDTTNPVQEQRARGWLLAHLHADLAQIADLGQRNGWRRCEAILADPTLDEVLARHAHEQPETIRILQWHLGRARERISSLHPHDWPGIIVHGDCTPWNLRMQHGQLSGVLDFELSHWDHRIADFALSWRGAYDTIVHAYHDVSPLEPEEWALLTPMWWAFLIEQACAYLRNGVRDDGWTIRQLLRRSPLMGADAVPFRPL